MAALLYSSAFGVAPCRAGRPQAAIGQRSLQAPRQRLAVRAAAAASEVESDVKKVADVEEFSDGPEVAPTTQQVQSFLNTLCDDTEILEMDLKMGTFQMYVRRSLGATGAPAPAAPAAPAPSVVLSSPQPHQTIDEHGAEESIDEALITVASPKVGIFRRGKYAGGKKVGKGNAVNEGDQVKKGQVLGFVEQLGTFVVVEAPQAGEVVSFYLKEGDAVEYGQNVLDMAPFFGGHIIGDRKYA